MPPRERPGRGPGNGAYADGTPPPRHNGGPGRPAPNEPRRFRADADNGRRAAQGGERDPRRAQGQGDQWDWGDRSPRGDRAERGERGQGGRSQARHAAPAGPGRGRVPPTGAATGKLRRSWLQRLALSAMVLLILALLTGAGGALWVIEKISSVDRIDDLEVDTVQAGEPSNYLIVGSDVRPESGEYGSVGGQRSDTIMIVRLDPESGEASLLSLPRDIMVPIAGDTSGELQKLNSAYSINHQTLVDTIRQNFGIEINHYVVVDFLGFERLVDAVGGIDLYFDRAVRDVESGLYVDQLGCVNLNGDQSLAFARSRHLQYMTEDGEWSAEDPLADLGRIPRQQMFVRAALTKVLEQITNPVRVTELVDIGTESVTLDGATDPFDLVDQFSDFDLNNLETFPLPVVDLEPRVSVQMDPVNAPPVLAIFRGQDPNEVPAESLTVTVLNGTGVESQANDVAAALQAVGFRLGERSDYEPQPVERTIVFHRPGEEIMGLRVARHITGGAELQVREDIESGEVVVVTGLDFTTVHMQPTPVDQMPGQPAADEAGTTTTTTPTQTTEPVQTTTTTLSPYTVGQPCS